MKQRIQEVGYVSYLLLILLFSGCSSNKMSLLKPTGDSAKITLHNTAVISAELISAEDSVLYIVVNSGWQDMHIPKNERFLGLRWESIALIKVQGYSNNNWVGPWVVFEVVPTILLTVAATSVESNNLFPALLLFGIPSGINGLILGISTPSPPRFREKITADKIDELKKYTRFPQGITKNQLNNIAAYFNQKNYRIL